MHACYSLPMQASEAAKLTLTETRVARCKPSDCRSLLCVPWVSGHNGLSAWLITPLQTTDHQELHSQKKYICCPTVT
jgi:hypothetical protein